MRIPHPGALGVHAPILRLWLLLPALLLAAACTPPTFEIPDRPAETAPAETPAPEVEPTPLPIVRSLPAAANVREGPGTDHEVRFWVSSGTPLTVMGRNADATWLHIEHEGRPGWVHGSLTDLDPAFLPALPVITGPDPEAAAEPTPEPVAPAPEPAPETVAPTPEPDPPPAPEPAPTQATSVRVTVTGTVVNLRTGPGTDHPTDGQVRAGMQVSVLGRNAAGDWLQIINPFATGELVWIYGPLTDIDAAATRTLADATTVVIEVASEPVIDPTPDPAALPPEATEAIADCTQWHTVNPNETRLSQITDWFGLDLQLVETINRFSDSERLEAGMLLCLRTSGIDTALTQVAPTASDMSVDVQQPAATPEPQPVAVTAPVTAGVCRTPKGQVQPCPSLPDFPERGHPNAPIGQKVVDSPLGVLWHAPGSYSRDLPGLDYDFELVFSDDSAMWNWSVRDFDACYDAVRVHMDEVPSEVGLQRLEVRLSDPVYDAGSSGFAYGTTYQSPWANMSGLPWDEWPNWNLANVPHPDLAQVNLGCSHLQPDGQVFCHLRPRWGNSHSIHLNAAVTLALANATAAFSDDAREYRHNRLDQRTIDFNAYLFPILNNRRGDPAGQGPCLDVTRVR